MYHEYWQLNSAPFGSRIGEGWFYDGPAHEEALARLLFLVEQRRPCGILTGPAGTGKSAVLATLADQLRRSGGQSIRLDVCGLSSDELLRQLADTLHLTTANESRPFLLWRGIRDHLHGLSRSQQQMVLMFDQFERADADCAAVLEQLLHLRHGSDCWPTVVAAVQPLSSAHSLLPLARLADLRIELVPWNRRETGYYVHESLQRAGADRELFEPDAIDALFAVTGGVPRHVNRLGELALLAGMADNRRTIDAAIVTAAAENLQPLNSSTGPTPDDNTSAVA